MQLCCSLILKLINCDVEIDCRFIAALQIESEMAELLENKNYEKADLLFKKATCDRKELLEERENLELVSAAFVVLIINNL